MKTRLNLVSTLLLGLGIIFSAPVSAETIPYKDGTIPKEAYGTTQLIPIQRFQNTFYFEGVFMEYTPNRLYIITRVKNPVCEEGQLDAAFYTRMVTKKGIVTTDVYSVQPLDQGKWKEYTFSIQKYFGELENAGVEVFTKSVCTVEPTFVAPQPLVPPVRIDNGSDSSLPTELPPVEKLDLPELDEGNKNRFDSILQKNKPNEKLPRPINSQSDIVPAPSIAPPFVLPSQPLPGVVPNRIDVIELDTPPNKSPLQREVKPLQLDPLPPLPKGHPLLKK